MAEARVAVVTGAASGLGQGYAVRLARAGFDLALVDRVQCATTEQMVAGAGRVAASFACDVADWDQAHATASAVVATLGRADVLVNNAGIYPNCRFDELDQQQWRDVMSVNLDGAFFMCHAFLAHMRSRRFGRIINIASAAVWLEVVNATPYIASKMGVIGLTRGLASEAGGDGITVNCIAPGMVQTPGTANAVHGGKFDALRGRQAVDIAAKPRDIAGTVAFLASDEAAFITGQTIVVDGGLTKH
ncbi:MAG TPA: SDR family oxidoreductase [Ilumatobacteraceae bacterium]